MRGWHVCFLAMAVAYLFERIPATGVYLMFFGSIVWSVLLINLGFLLMALDGLGSRHRRWLLLPSGLYFGGYFLAAGLSHWQVARFNGRIAAANHGQSIAFDPSTHDLLIEGDANDRSGLTLSYFVRQFALDRAYQHTAGRTGSSAITATYSSFQLVNMICPSFAETHDASITRAISYEGHQYRSAADLCEVTGSATPDFPTVRVEHDAPVESGWLTHYVFQHVTLTAWDGRALHLQSGWAEPLSWLPTPILGCSFAGSAGWVCLAKFGRGHAFGWNGEEPPYLADQVVARALGIRMASVRQRHPNAGWNG